MTGVPSSFAQPLGAVDGGAVIEQADFAVGDFRDLVDAEETARRLDRRNTGAPQRRHRKAQDDEPEETHRPLPLKQHRRRQQRQQNLETAVPASPTADTG